MPELSIVILTYNNSRQIITCLGSIFEQYMEELTSAKLGLVVLDNNSTDDTFESIKKYLEKKNIYKLSSIKFERIEENKGFAAGINKAVTFTKSPYFVFINPDSKVLDNHLFHMMNFLKEHPKIGVMGGKIIDKHNTPELSSGNFLNLLNFIFMITGLERFKGFGFRKSPSKLQRVDFVSGGYMMISREAFDKVHGFDEGYFMYMEDMDLCFRLKKRGLRTYFYPEAIIEHEKHGSSSRSFAIVGIYKGILRFFKKHRDTVSYFLVKFILLAKAVILVILGKVTGNSYLTKTYEEAYRVS